MLVAENKSDLGPFNFNIEEIFLIGFLELSVMPVILFNL